MVPLLSVCIKGWQLLRQLISSVKWLLRWMLDSGWLGLICMGVLSDCLLFISVVPASKNQKHCASKTIKKESTQSALEQLLISISREKKWIAIVPYCSVFIQLYVVKHSFKKNDSGNQTRWDGNRPHMSYRKPFEHLICIRSEYCEFGKVVLWIM